MTPVTDPLILQSLNNQAGSGAPLQPVDPATAAQLDAASAPNPILNSPIGGFIRGLRDPIDQGASLLAHGLTTLFPNSQFLQQQLADTQAVNRAAEQDYAQNWRGGQPVGADVGRIAGDIAGTLPISYAMPGSLAASLPARIASGAASGALSGALSEPTTPGGNFWQQKAEQAAEGGLLGAAGAPIAGALSRLVQPNAVANAAPLMEQGVRPTPGQLLGGAVNRLEEAGQSVPFLGDFIKSGRARAVEQFDRGAINQALAPIGQSLSTDKIGRDAIAEMNGKISDAYKAAVPQAGAQLDPQAIGDLTNLHQMAQMMPADRARQFSAIMQQKVLDKISPGGGMTGESFKEAESDLGKMASGYLYGNNTSDERQLGGALRELQSTLRNWLGRVNPDAAGDIQAANRAYAMSLRVGNAAGRLGGEPGVFSPAQLVAATKSLSPARQFEQGTALMQPYAETGKSVLGAKVPDSGTPFRSLAAILGASALGHGLSPEAATGAAGLGAGAAAIYSPLGQALIARAIASRPAMAGPLAQAVRNASPAFSSAFPAIGQGGLLTTP